MSPEESQSKMVTVADALAICMQALESSDLYYGHGTDNAWDEAVQLVLTVAELPVDAGEEVLGAPITVDHLSRIDELLAQRSARRIPLPYPLGRAWFAGLEFICDPRAIVPRSPIAELILQGFLPWYAGPAPRRVLDLCCGGGGIGLATAYHHPQVSVDMLDIDAPALSLANENIRKFSLQGRVQAQQSDVFSALQDERYDLILCNPPYVDATDLAAMPAEFAAEPELALGSGEDGLALTRQILAEVGKYLEPHGLLVLEVGYTWPALEAAYPAVPFTWVELANGGEGVCVISASDWQDYSASFTG